MEIIMNEFKYAENLLSKSHLCADDLGKKPSATLNLLARYYREIGKSDNEIKKCLETFLSNCLGENFQVSKWIESISYQVKRSKKYSLKRVGKVCITQNEIDIIQQVKSKPQQKLLFTLLTVAKYYNAVSERNNNWTNLEMKQLFKLANVQLTTQKQALMIHELYKNDFVILSKKVGKPNIAVQFIDDNSESVLEITRLKDLGKEYLYYYGENYVRCERCGDLMKKVTNNNKYCKNCGGYHPIKTKTLTCIDCGKEFVVDSNIKNKKRCDECQRELRLEQYKEYNKKR